MDIVLSALYIGVLGVYSVLVKQAVTNLSLFMQESNNSLQDSVAERITLLLTDPPEALTKLVRDSGQVIMMVRRSGLTLAGGEAAGVGQAALVPPAPAGGGPVPGPGHAAAAHLQHQTTVRILLLCAQYLPRFSLSVTQKDGTRAPTQNLGDLH